MRNCPKCNNAVKEKIKFCPFCGFNLKEHRKKKIKNIAVGIAIFFIFLFIAEIAYNVWYEKENSKPFEISLTIDNTDLIAKTRLENKDGIFLKWKPAPKIIYIDITMEQKIEPWQIEAMGKDKPRFELFVKNDSEKEKLKACNVKFEKGQNLELHFKIDNANLKKYIEIKNALSKENSIELSSPKIFSCDTIARKKMKKEYFAWKEQQRQRQLQAAQEAQRQYESRLMQMMYYGGYGYY